MNGTQLKGEPVGRLIEQFFGKLKQWPTEPDGVNWTQSQIKAIAAHMSETGECLWHAMKVTQGWEKCNCAACAGEVTK